MSDGAADRIRKTLEERRLKAESQAAQRAANAQEKQATWNASAERVGIIVRPVFAEAAAIVKEEGNRAEVEDLLQAPRAEYHLHSIALHTAVANKSDRLSLAIFLHDSSDQVGFSVGNLWASASPLPQSEIPIEELTEELVWSWVEKLVERMPRPR